MSQEELVVIRLINVIYIGWCREKCIVFVMNKGYDIRAAIRITDEAFTRISEGYDRVAN